MLLCPFLNEYKQLVDEAEEYLDIYGEDGLALAIESCIKNGILIEYLTRKTLEVIKMFSAEYSYALQLEASKEDGRREGRKQGIEQGIEQGREEERFIIARSFRDMGISIDKIAKATGLSEEKIKSL